MDYPDDEIQEDEVQKSPSIHNISVEEPTKEETAEKEQDFSMEFLGPKYQKPPVFLSKADIEAARRVYETVTSFSSNKAELDFDSFVKNIKHQLKTMLQGETDPLKCKPEVLNSKRFILDHCFEGIIFAKKFIKE